MGEQYGGNGLEFFSDSPLARFQHGVRVFAEGPAEEAVFVLGAVGVGDAVGAGVAAEGDLAADGTFVRVTGWMGCKSLDADLYGDNGRWEPMN